MSGIIFWIGLLQTTAKGDVGELFGFGSQSAGVSGATVAADVSAFSTYINPAALGSLQNKKFEFAWSLLAVHPKMTSVDHIVTQNSTNSDQTGNDVVRESADVSNPNITGQFIGLTALINKDWLNLGVGLSAYLPIEGFNRLDTGEPFVPDYSLFRARTSRPQVYFGTGANIFHDFYFGFGVQLAFSITSKSTAFLATESTKSSNMRTTTSYRPKPVPYLGGLWQESESTSYGVTLRLPASSTMINVVETKSEFFAGGGAPEVVITSRSVLAYDPWTLQWGAKWLLPPWWTLLVQLDYQLWSLMKAPHATIEGGQDGILVQNSKYPPPKMKNILTPRLGLARKLSDSSTLKAGYFYRQATTLPSSTSSDNLLDPPRHSFSLGYAIGIMGGVLDVFMLYQWWVEQKITKSSSTEIGAPYYNAGGSVYGGGISVTIPL